MSRAKRRAEYERWAERALRLAEGQLTEFLDFLERAYEIGGDDIEELISVSFLEHLPRPSEPGSELRDRVGPTLRQQLAVIG